MDRGTCLVGLFRSGQPRGLAWAASVFGRGCWPFLSSFLFGGRSEAVLGEVLEVTSGP